MIHKETKSNLISIPFVILVNLGLCTGLSEDRLHEHLFPFVSQIPILRLKKGAEKGMRSKKNLTIAECLKQSLVASLSHVSLIAQLRPKDLIGKV